MNDETDGKHDETPTSRNIWPLISSIFGSFVQMIFIGLGIGAAAHMISLETDGFRYWVSAALCLATYCLGAIFEFYGDYLLKKERI